MPYERHPFIQKFGSNHNTLHRSRLRSREEDVPLICFSKIMIVSTLLQHLAPCTCRLQRLRCIGTPSSWPSESTASLMVNHHHHSHHHLNHAFSYDDCNLEHNNDSNHDHHFRYRCHHHQDFTSSKCIISIFLYLTVALIR